MNLPMLPVDKANHVVYGAVISAVVGFALGPLAGLIAALAAGAFKEALDWWMNRKAVAAGLPPSHDVDVFDFLATAAGGLLVFIG